MTETDDIIAEARARAEDTRALEVAVFDSYDLPGTVCLGLNTKAAFLPTVRLSLEQCKDLRKMLKKSMRVVTFAQSTTGMGSSRV